MDEAEPRGQERFPNWNTTGEMSIASGSQYPREDDARLPDLLAPMSRGRVVESDTVLWQGYWWFIPNVGLLTAEWITRKRVWML